MIRVIQSNSLDHIYQALPINAHSCLTRTEPILSIHTSVDAEPLKESIDVKPLEFNEFK